MSAKRLSEKDLAGALDKRVGIRISRTDLLNEALTHASAREASGADYQRLEFLGDRVLGLVVLLVGAVVSAVPLPSRFFLLAFGLAARLSSARSGEQR